MADDPIDTASDQRVPGLDSDQPAEPRAEHKDGPDPQGTTGRKEHNAEPAYRLAVDDPERFPVRIGGQIGSQQPEQRQGADDPAVATILAQTSA
jgi:hypothetical protein